jgi:REP element-mobilizing transposase RayT
VETGNDYPFSCIEKIIDITAREIFSRKPLVNKKEFWGGEFWTDGYYVGTVGERWDTVEQIYSKPRVTQNTPPANQII